MSEREHRNALIEQAANTQAVADQAARAAVLAALPCRPVQLLALFDRLDTMLDEGCHHDWRACQAWADAQGVDWPPMQAWLQARSADSTDEDGASGEVNCDCAVWLYVRPRWTDALVQAAGLSQAHVTLFPGLDEVFHEPTPLMASVFLPLLSIDLPSLGMGTGRVHAMSIWDSGIPELAWLAPDLDFDQALFDWDGERYRFRGDLSGLERLHPLPDWHAEARTFYQSHALDADAFRGMLAQRPGPWQALQTWAQQRAGERLSFMQHWVHFWLARDAYRATGRLLLGSAYLKGHSPHERAPHGHLLRTPPFTADGQGWQKVGSLVGHNYVDGGEDGIQLYLSRERGQVLQRFGWS